MSLNSTKIIITVNLLIYGKHFVIVVLFDYPRINLLSMFAEAPDFKCYIHYILNYVSF